MNGDNSNDPKHDYPDDTPFVHRTPGVQPMEDAVRISDSGFRAPPIEGPGYD